MTDLIRFIQVIRVLKAGSVVILLMGNQYASRFGLILALVIAVIASKPGQNLCRRVLVAETMNSAGMAIK